MIAMGHLIQTPHQRSSECDTSGGVSRQCLVSNYTEEREHMDLVKTENNPAAAAADDVAASRAHKPD